MKTFLQVSIFSICLLFAYSGVAHLLPQLESKPEEEEAIVGEDLSIEDFVDLGEALFKGKGTCTLCHNANGRAPDILALDMIQIAQTRMESQRYQGEARNVEEYLRESMIAPSAYVVAGFGVKGSNDAQSPMPAVIKAPINLSEIEVNAIIAFLQSKDGGTPTVAVPASDSSEVAVEENTTQAVLATTRIPAQTAEDALQKYGCVACHQVLNFPGGVGPPLIGIGKRETAESIRKSILDPNAVIVKGFSPVMPPTLKDQMTAGELELIVTYLQKL